ncbi:MAG: fumarylacetoacetate hydrolase family protein [Rhodobacteraceae bacterium]|nr:fumarylacetoacetate hydrolase family protein [Paracoccaceae bacterium]
MADFTFPPPPRPSLPIVGSDHLFPVRRIFCVGRNYREHAREMGHDPDRSPPFFFTKPADALVRDGVTIPYPPATGNLHHEAELVVALGPGAEVFGFAVGNDLTRRDLQAEAKKLGRPWDMAKGFDQSAVCGPVHLMGKTGPMSAGQIALTVNSEVRQKADLADMIWPLPDILAALSGMVKLAAGDLIYTGTPAGVGALNPGDVCEVSIEGLGSVKNTIGETVAPS